MKYLKFCLFSITLGFFISNVSAQDSSTIMAQILQSNNLLANGNIPIEQRIDAYGNIQGQIDEIINQFPGSAESIAFLSNQAIGNFNVGDFRNAYITELTEYYDVTCESSPSLQCLGFVALNLGIETCKSANDFDGVNLGQGQIQNAIKIFNTDESSKSYVSLATNAFRNCVLDSRLSNADLLQDFFAQNLVSLYLSIDDEAQARATIQRIENPYLTFLSVIDLTEYQGGINREFIDRMKQYQNTNSFTGPYSDKFAILKLNSLILDYDLEGNFFEGIQLDQLDRNPSNEEILFSLEYLDDLISFIDKYIEAFDSPNRYYYNLHQNGLRDLGIGTGLRRFDTVNMVLNGYIALRVTSKDVADNFYLQSKLSGFETNMIQEQLFETSGRNEFQDYALRFPNADGLDDALFWERERDFPFDEFRQWKKSIREGFYCEGITTLFSDLKGQEEFPDAIDYLSSSLSNLEEIPSCGDSSLELLLQ